MWDGAWTSYPDPFRHGDLDHPISLQVFRACHSFKEQRFRLLGQKLATEWLFQSRKSHQYWPR